MKVTVFGNEIDDKDSTALTVVKLLTQELPLVEFIHSDPTESLNAPTNPWIILDSAIGIDHVTLIESLDDLEYIKGSSVHDFDVYMELRLKAKLNQLPQLKIILVPDGDDPTRAASHVAKILNKISLSV